MATIKTTIKRRNGTGWDELRPKTEVDQITDFDANVPDVINDLTNVNAPSPSDGQALVWDNSTSKWVPGTVASTFNGGTITNDLTISKNNTNVSITLDGGTGASILNMNGTGNSFIEKDEGNHLYIANNSVDKDIYFRTRADSTTYPIIMTIDGSTSNVGIGTTAPAEKLEVAGSIQANSNFKFKGSGGYYLYNSSGTFRGGIIDDGGATKIYGDGNGSTPIITLDGGNIKTGGNLIFDDDANNSDYLIDFQEHPDGTYGAYIRYDGSASNALEIGTRNAGTETESIFIDRNTADVTFRQDVDVQGNLTIQSTFPRIYFIDSDSNPDYSIFNGNGAFAIYDDTNSQYRLRFNSAGNAVFGNSSPSNLGFLERSLQIKAGSATDTTLKQAGLVITGSSDSDDADDFGYLSFTNNHSTLSNGRVAELRIVKNGTNVNTADMKFYTANGTSLAAKMTLTNDGKLGIGTELPSSTLEVVGDIRANRMYDRTNTSYYVDPASTSILYNIDVQNTTTTRGSVVVDTDTNQNLFYISRTGSTSQEYTSFGRDDTTTHIHTKNDESSSTIRFRIENTDTESGGGANANDRNIDFISDATRAQIQIAGQRVATENYVDTEISSLVASAPDALNTLNELAAALGDDENFSTTVTNNLAGKLNLTGGTLTGTLTSRAINMQNYNLSNVGALSFNDPGPNEGISWSGGNFKIYESPNNLTTNSAGNLQFVSGGSRRLTVQTDGTVYVPGTLKAEKVEIEGALFDVESNSLRMPMVKGGHFNDDTSSVTGAIFITLPSGTYANATMMNFFVDVFDYAGGSDGESFTLHIGGYNYTDGTWHNVFANLISGRTDRFFTVRFNYDSTNSANIIYIAETTSNWAYPKVTVRDFSAGYSGADDADWYNNSFNVGISSTMLGTTSRSKTAENVASYALNADKLDNIQATSFVRSDASDTMAGDYRIESGSFASLILDRGTTGSGSVVQFENNNGIIGGIGAFGDDGLQFRTTDGTQMVIDASNRVGIGTTSPASTLDVRSDDGLYITTATNNPTNGAQIRFSDHSSQAQYGFIKYKHANQTVSTEPVNSDDGFIIGGSETNTVVSIEGSLNVEGETNFEDQVEIDSGDLLVRNGAGIFDGNASNRVLYLRGNGNIVQFQGASNQNVWEVVGREANFYIYNNDLSKYSLFIDDGTNNIGINGQGSPSQALDVIGSIKASNDMYAARYYDLNNTSYYIDSGSTSVMNAVQFQTLQSNKTSYGEPNSENFYRLKIQNQGGTHNDVGLGQTASGNLGYNVTAANAHIFYEGTNGEIARLQPSGLALNHNGTGTVESKSITFTSQTADTDVVRVLKTTSGGNLDFNAGAITLNGNGNIVAKGNLYLNNDNLPTGEDATIYFGDDASDTAHNLIFDNSVQRFKFSNAVESVGSLITHANLYLNYDNSPAGTDPSIYFGDDTADSTHYIQFDNSGQRFKISNTLDVIGSITTSSNLYLNYDNSPTGTDAYIYFGDDTADSTHWMRFDNSAQQFGFSNRVVGTAGRLGAIESNGSDVDKVNFQLSGTTLTITTS